MDVIHSLKHVIDDKEIPSVGGNIQYGEINSVQTFTIDGIVVPEKDMQMSNKFFLGGIDVLDDVFDETYGLQMTGKFIKPFS